MKKVIQGKRLPIKMWLNDCEDGALQQAYNLSDLPFAFKHIALMPDCHQGYGMPIGGVLATKNVIIPNCVGVDIGCGVVAVKTNIQDIGRETLKVIMGKVRQEVPVGFKKHSKPKTGLPSRIDHSIHLNSVIDREYENASISLGTLGGGNHFIEFQEDCEKSLWLMIHSGSRNLGYKVAEYYNKLAVFLNEKWHSSVPKKYELAFLPVDSSEGQDYINEMSYCVDFAFANRSLMMDRIITVLLSEVKHCFKAEPMINIAHNYAALENHFGQNVWIHRKGATLAREGTIGIIPGSQGTKSYIVKGKGNPESFMSCSHGAGRKMSRTAAKKNLNLADEIKKLNDQDIVHGIRHVNDLDEAAGAYKDISVIMANQSDLVEVVEELTPIGVIKG